ncbi:Uncharacterised protein [uncultured archaeon]|nr:Uncharacterised protein [uncultured archaeon]
MTPKEILEWFFAMVLWIFAAVTMAQRKKVHGASSYYLRKKPEKKV